MTYFEQQLIELRDYAGQKDYVYQQLSLARQFIRSNLEHPITVDHAAGAACFSKYHFIRLFKSVYHCTPHEYLTDLRIEKAKQLLLEGQTIGQVCYSVGFSSHSSFKLLFKRYTRHTPYSFSQKMKRSGSTKAIAVSPFLLYYKKSNFRARVDTD